MCGLFFLGSAVGGSMPTDGTLLLEHMPNGKQYLVTALSVFFSFGSVLSAVVGLLVIPEHSCPPAPAPCDVSSQNSGWKYLLSALGIITLSMFLARIVFFRLHESPRYLVHAGRQQEALESLQLIARFNGDDLDLGLEDVQDHAPAAVLGDGISASPTRITHDTESAFGNPDQDSSALVRRSGAPLANRAAHPTVAPWVSREDQSEDVYDIVNVRGEVKALLEAAASGAQACVGFRGPDRDGAVAGVDAHDVAGVGGVVRHVTGIHNVQRVSTQFVGCHHIRCRRLSRRYRVFFRAVCLNLLGAYLIESPLGRRWSLAGSTFVTAFFCVIFVWVEQSWAVRASTVGIGLSATAMWAVLYGWTPEMFGTKVRGSACGIASALSRIGGMIAPMLGGALLSINNSVPVYASIVIFVLAGLCVLLLHEEKKERSAGRALMH
ncbi:hypothetical protein IEO21_08295 [Rhodonia placenta]|uniref:Major facilitator superfamily (MFS) profile domain-containing protein n=1 Tax=Rhodonia placenta TaxID=104341 RepID=A0A8H7TZI8_9APHY|nr:hypothetical protein IEO21_08295 [Postia placenta]